MDYLNKTVTDQNTDIRGLSVGAAAAGITAADFCSVPTDSAAC